MDRFIRWMAGRASTTSTSQTSRRDFLGTIGAGGLALATLLFGPAAAHGSTKKKATKKKATKKKAAKKKKTKKGVPTPQQVRCTYTCEHPDEGEVEITLCRGADRACPDTLNNVGRCTVCTRDSDTPTSMKACLEDHRDLSACLN